MQHAWRDLGQREIAGPKANARLRALYQRIGHGHIRHDEVAWCAAYVGACLERAGRSSTRSLAARSYLSWGEALDAPRLGCIAVFSRGPQPALGHVGFWVGQTPNHVLVLGGNQGDAVSVAAIARKRLLGYRWPAPTSAEANAPEPLFEQALAHVLEREGGWSNDPHDAGGPTNYGITLADFARFKALPIRSNNRARLIKQLKQISQDDVHSIYLQAYWRPSRSAQLPPALALMHFDASVNHGLDGAARLLQRAVGVDIDGEIGPRTLAAARGQPAARVLQRYAELRRRRYRSLPHFWRFGRGWLRRVDLTLDRAHQLLATTPTPSPDSKHGELDMGHSKSGAQPQQPHADGSKWWGHSMTIWGTLLTAASTVIPTIAPLFGLDITAELVEQIGRQIVQLVQALGGLIGILLTVYGRSRASSRIERRLVTVSI